MPAAEYSLAPNRAGAEPGSHPLPLQRPDLAGLLDNDRVAGDGGGELGEQFGRLPGDVDFDAGNAAPVDRNSNLWKRGRAMDG